MAASTCGMKRVQAAYRWSRAAAHVVLGSPVIFIPVVRNRFAGRLSDPVGRAIFGLWVYIVFWAVVWGLTAWLIPRWFTDSAAGLQTALQVLPAVIVALLVLILGSIAVIAQMAASTWGTRAPVVLTLDQHLQELILRPLVLLVAVLLLAGQVPQGTPSDAVTAAVGVVALATIVISVRAATYLPVVPVQSLAPTNFGLQVLGGVQDELSAGRTGRVVFRVGLLGEALRSSIRREDNVAALAMLQAMRDLHSIYLAALAIRPEIRSHELDEPGESREGWMVRDLTSGLVQAGEQALRDFASTEVSDQINSTLAVIGQASIDAEETTDAEEVVDSFIRLGTTASQVTPGGFVNFQGMPPEELAGLSGRAGRAGYLELAVRGLAGWALVTAYPYFHFNIDRLHPTWRHCMELLGDDPPWEGAIELVTSEQWMSRWANQQHAGPLPVLEVILTAQNWDPELDPDELVWRSLAAGSDTDEENPTTDETG